MCCTARENRSMKTRNPFEFVSATFRNSPWIMISVSVHVIAIAILAVWYIAKPKPPLIDVPITIVCGPPPLPEEVPLEPQVITQRDFIPKLDPAILDSQPIDLQDTIPITDPPNPTD